MILRSQLRWTGHIIRMEDHRVPKQLLFGERARGYRNSGRPRKRYKDNLKEALQWYEIEPKELVSIAQDRIK